MKHEELTKSIIKAFYEAYNRLGWGFLEKVYDNALSFEFEYMGLKFERQVPIRVFYRGRIAGDYVADFIVEDKIIVEVKALVDFSGKEECQLVNYLRATDKEVGLVLNFGKEAGIRRRVFDNELKGCGGAE